MVIYIDIDSIRFIEGHARLRLYFKDGRPVAEFCITEGSRFIPKVLEKRFPEEAPVITSRICGVCHTAHALASVKAIESAIGIKVDSLVEKARTYILLLNYLQSHLLHLAYMTFPTITNVYSIFRIKDKSVLEIGSRLAISASKVFEKLGGRAVHVPLFAAGGFSYPISGRRLAKVLKENFERKLKESVLFAEKILNLGVPEFERHRALGAIKMHREYIPCEADPKIATTLGEIMSKEEYYSRLKPVFREYSTSQHVLFDGEELTVGALSRIIINKRLLSLEAKELAERIEWKPDPFLIVKAQAIEVVDTVAKLEYAPEELRDLEIEPIEPPRVEEARGVGVVEAPRGLLAHYCEIRNYRIYKYVIIVPTAVNSRSIERDSEILTLRSIHLGSEKLKIVLEDLVRAYDPCTSCAVSLDHTVKI